ncbi:MAG: hypothetical protein F2534_18475 [Actinobacteria bacterium]|uniref:Unannotated protein n=1 Tax=freshwater metagenome TaxID=449393 RepID=A0A6J6FKJ7_9ZZZZ|nr:hypothetical protein [Actinomycetota bacterium]
MDGQPERRVALTLIDSARTPRGANRERRRDANAPAGQVPTVATVPANNSLTTARQIDKTRRALGGITELAVGPAPAPSTGPLPRVVTHAPDPVAAFPCGASTRRLDEPLRTKFAAGDMHLGELLGWRDGTLDTVCVNGWLVLTQRPDGIGAVGSSQPDGLPGLGVRLPTIPDRRSGCRRATNVLVTLSSIVRSVTRPESSIRNWSPSRG